MIENNLDGNVLYLRYWQGFRVIVRPLLLFLSFQDIRKLYAVVFFILFSCMTAAIAKKQNFKNAIAIAVSVSLFNPAVVSHSLQYAPCFLLMFVFSIYVVMRDIKAKKLGLLFALFGMLTQYFDFYTAPIITCAVPLLLIMSKESQEQSLWKTLSVCCLSWLYGYVAIWIIKLLMVTIFTQINGFGDGFTALVGRLSGNSNSKLSSIILAFKWVWWLSSPGRNPKETAIVLLIAIVVACVLVYARNKDGLSALMRKAPFLVVAGLPLVWFAVSSDPTIIHAEFQYRATLPLYAGVFMFICQCLPDSLRHHNNTSVNVQ